MRLTPFLLLGSVFVVMAACGCSKEERRGPPVYEVTGQVTVNGTPIKDGAIQFTSPEDMFHGSEASAMINEGRYTALVTEGKKKVMIWDPEPVGPADSTGSQRRMETLPPKFNVQSTLECEVAPDDTNEVSFSLKK